MVFLRWHSPSFSLDLLTPSSLIGCGIIAPSPAHARAPAGDTLVGVLREFHEARGDRVLCAADRVLREGQQGVVRSAAAGCSLLSDETGGAGAAKLQVRGAADPIVEVPPL